MGPWSPLLHSKGSGWIVTRDPAMPHDLASPKAQGSFVRQSSLSGEKGKKKKKKSELFVLQEKVDQSLLCL